MAKIFIQLLCEGELTAAQALDKVTTQDYVLIDVRSDKDKAKAGVPQLPSNAKNKLISVPYAVISSLVATTRPLSPYQLKKSYHAAVFSGWKTFRASSRAWFATRRKPRRRSPL